MNTLSNPAYLDVEQYPQTLLQILDDAVQVQVSYKKVWDDDFGARGWKLDATIGDPEIIASTRDTGQKIPTSVFVHDILDHFLSGFGVSGHRSEAMALIQLYKRTGSDPRPDYEQMVKEDIINGRVNGESLITFLPEKLRAMLPEESMMADKEIIEFLKGSVDEKHLITSLVENFFTLGKSGENHASKSWKKLGLDTKKRTEIGLALQNVLNEVDRIAEESGVETIKASIIISKETCIFNLHDALFSKTEYRANIA